MQGGHKLGVTYTPLITKDDDKVRWGLSPLALQSNTSMDLLYQLWCGQ
jgi:hypothetical protein